MENRELKEYLAEFADGTQVSVIIANPKKKKSVYSGRDFYDKRCKNRETGALHRDSRRKRDGGG